MKVSHKARDKYSIFLNMLVGALIVLLLASQAAHMVFAINYDAHGKFNAIEDAVRHQVRYISGRVHGGGALEMQKIFPEGYIFTNSFYGFSLINIYFADPGAIDKRFIVGELKRLIGALESDEALGILRQQGFSDRSRPAMGIIYSGQLNLLLGGLQLIEPSEEYASRFHARSSAIHKAYNESLNGLLTSYANISWPADNIAAMQSLKIHDQLYGTTYGRVYDKWKATVIASVDSATGLLPAQVDPFSGAAIEGPRGCAMSLTVAFMSGLDYPLAKSQYLSYKKHFFSRVGPFWLIREWPQGVSGTPDVDSGPVLAGYGMAATGLGLAAAHSMGDIEVFAGINRSSEIFGFPTDRMQQRKYIGDHLLLGDILILWGKTVRPWSHGTQLITTGPSSNGGQYIYSALIIVLFALLSWAIIFSLRKDWRILKSGEYRILNPHIGRIAIALQLIAILIYAFAFDMNLLHLLLATLAISLSHSAYAWHAMRQERV